MCYSKQELFTHPQHLSSLSLRLEFALLIVLFSCFCVSMFVFLRAVFSRVYWFCPFGLLAFKCPASCIQRYFFYNLLIEKFPIYNILLFTFLFWLMLICKLVFWKDPLALFDIVNKSASANERSTTKFKAIICLTTVLRYVLPDPKIAMEEGGLAP